MIIDDFPGTSLNTDYWYDNPGGSGGGHTVNNGILTIYSEGNGSDTIRSHEEFIVGQELLVVEMRVKVGAPVDSGAGWRLINSSCQLSVGFGFSDESSELEVIAGVPTNKIKRELSHIDGSQWHTYRIEHEGNVARFYVDDELEATIDDTDALRPGSECPLHIKLTRGTSPINSIYRTISIDFVYVTSVAN